MTTSFVMSYARRLLRPLFLAALCMGGGLLAAPPASAQPRPNIVWIVAEDMGPDIGAYGNTLVDTPNLDRLARESVQFDRVFVTNPICSPSRSALISGMYQTTLGAHNHRSQREDGKGGGNTPFYDSYEVPEGIRLVPELFREAGYYTVLGGSQRADGAKPGQGKSDYNFIWDGAVYDGDDWGGRASGQPFFAQVQLGGGKERKARVADPADPADVVLPPYYPDHPVLRKDWAEYLNAVAHLDVEVGEVLDRLDREGLADETVVVFMSDHGISHARGKQFLYDEGLRVPLLIRWPGRLVPGSVRRDLVQHIDVAATSLGLAGIPVPGYLHARDVFAPGYQPHAYVYAGRDRADETVDVIRSVRGPRYKYIRNYYSDRPHLQPNQYKDGKEIIQVMRVLHGDGVLTPLQARVLTPTRPPEELYDTWLDPFETVNLAASPGHAPLLEKMRGLHVDWMKETRDMGLVPEPILDELGRTYGSKYAAMQAIDHGALIDAVRSLIAAAEQGTAGLPALRRGLQQDDPALRYWAARGLSYPGVEAAGAHDLLVQALGDPSPGVRVAAARTLGLAGRLDLALPVLTRALASRDNLITGMYAALALEDLGDDARPALEALERVVSDDPYELTGRVAVRVIETMRGAAGAP